MPEPSNRAIPSQGTLPANCPEPQQKTGYLPYVILFLFSSALYAKSMAFDFIPTWDDAAYVLDNPSIRGITLVNLRGIFSTEILGNYAPVHILSYLADYAVWGLSPRGYHLTNILLHGLNACLAFALITLITNRQGIAFFSALLFVVHPLNVENVAWVTERKTLIATLFLFLSLISYIKYRFAASDRFPVQALLFFTAAVLAKGSVVIMPLILVSYERFIRGKRISWPLLAPFFAIAACASAVQFWTHRLSGSVGDDILTSGFLFGTVYPTMLPVFWKYVSLIMLPFNLSGYYDKAIYHSFADLPVALSLVSWLLVTAAVFRRGTGQVKFWYIWYWLCLLPVSNIIPIPAYYADRYMYTPALGAFVLIILILSKKEEAGSALQSCFLPAGMAVRYGIFVMIAVLLAGLTFKRLDVWQNELVFWEDTAAKSPANYKTQMNIGLAYEKIGRLGEAEAAFLRSIALYETGDAVLSLQRTRTKIRLNRELQLYPTP